MAFDFQVENNGYLQNTVLRTLDCAVSPLFESVTEVLNICFGCNYKKFNNSYCELHRYASTVWFPAINNDESTRFFTSIKCNGELIVQKTEEVHTDLFRFKSTLYSSCYVFGKYKDGFRFLGLYKYCPEKCDKDTYVFRRIAEVVDLSCFCQEKEYSNLKIVDEITKTLTLEQLRAKALEAAEKYPAFDPELERLGNSYMKVYVKRKAAGVCQLCGNKAPFNDIKGVPFLELHHIRSLLSWDQDTLENLIALCPNCHRKMHILKNQKDKSTLTKKAREQ